MRRTIPVNLASEPFRRTRPILVATSLAGGVLMALLVALITMAWRAREEAGDARQAIAQAQRQVATLAAEQGRLEAALRKAENAEVLDRSLFLNSLLRRKGVSWTRIFGDLEQVMPHNVRLISIRPQIMADNRIQLQMVVGAQSGEPVIEMLMKLEESPLFGATAVTNWLPPSQSEPLYRYRVSVHYAQEL